MQLSNLAPIALFVYNRPEHTRLTVEALQKNSLVSQSDLIIFSDAPKTEAQAEAVSKVRQYIHQIDGFKSVKIIEREKNWGLARSIIEGVTLLCNEYGRVIVLEDDLETSPFFLRYMNDALNFYNNTPEVMHISGCRYPIGQVENQDTFFLHVPLCWGWGTWQRAWKSFENDIEVMNRFNSTMINHFDFDNTYSYWQQLELNKSGKINTWFVFWYATLYLKSGLSLFPARSLVRNIGFDDSGTHCGKTGDYDVELCDVGCNLKTIPLEETQDLYQAHVEYFRTLKPSLPVRALNFVKRVARSHILRR